MDEIVLTFMMGLYLGHLGMMNGKLLIFLMGCMGDDGWGCTHLLNGVVLGMMDGLVGVVAFPTKGSHQHMAPLIAGVRGRAVEEVRVEENGVSRLHLHVLGSEAALNLC